jgi:hypothetical protein
VSNVSRVSFGWLTAATLLFGCDAGLGPSPRDVVQTFWTAVAAGDAETWQPLCVEGSAGALAEDLPEISEVLLGETLDNDQRAIVRTSLLLAAEDGALRVTFDTHLIRSSGEWRVDGFETGDGARRAVLVAGMRRVGEAIGEGMGEWSRALQEGLREATDALRESLEHLEPPPVDPQPSDPHGGP